MNKIQEIIKEICEEKNIEFNLLSKNWIMCLEKGNKTRFIAGYKFDLNNHGVGIVLDDKYAFYEVLKHKNINVCEHKIIFENYNKEDVLSYYNKYNHDLVVKTNLGTCGTTVFHITNYEELIPKIDELLLSNFSISICPFYNIKTEYRIIMLNNEPVLYYGKKRPIVYGDGVKSVKELLHDFNPLYFNDDKKYTNYLIDINYIPKENEKIEYGWQFNLSRGSICFDIEDKVLLNKLLNIAKCVTKELNLSFASVDIIETYDENLLVLESNSGVMMENFVDLVPDGKKIAYKIYGKAIDEMFK